MKIGDELLMFDCGPASTHKLVKAGMFPTQVDNLFFTHHHFDHNIDYPCFLLCRWDQAAGNGNELNVYGPNLTEEITQGLIGENGVFSPDWRARAGHPLSQQIYVNRGGTLPRTPPNPQAKNVGPGEVASGKNWEVTAALAEHVQPWLDSLAYRVDTPDGSVVFTGDTQPCKSVTDLAQGADMMLCMCWDDQAVMAETGEAIGQCGTTGAAEMAQEAGVKKLVLVHMGPGLSAQDPFYKATMGMQRIYQGDIVFSEELLKIEL
tara:strand:+ start:1057 stop:1845 length:789 start_codon:yes stop_codon:yes gene_type:complete